MRSLKLSSLVAVLTLALMTACAEPECPHGFYKIDKTCLRLDGGKSVTSSEAGVNAADDETEDDAGRNNAFMDASTGVDSGTSSGLDGGGSSPGPVSTTDAAVVMDATTSVAPTGDAGSNPAPAPECDSTHPCGAGFVCSAMKCASACTQAQCDPNATCSLIANAPVCTCNRGFIAMTGTGGAITCARDVACEELGCDINAGCEIINQLRTCVCKNGYTGNGKSCAPVSCDTPKIDNGTVNAPEGITFNKTATYRCNDGFRQSGGSWTRTCGSNMQWSGTQPTCSAITCLAPDAPQNGFVATPQGREFGDPANYTCASGYKLQGSMQRTCQEQGWSGSSPTCAATCGNSAWDQDVQEPCDPTAQGWNAWTCSGTCTKKTIYTKCSSSSPCSTGETCAATLNVCIKSCSTSAQCPATVSARGAICPAETGGSPYCFASCNTASDCAPGLGCTTTGKFCVDCSSSPSSCQ